MSLHGLHSKSAGCVAWGNYRVYFEIRISSFELTLTEFDDIYKEIALVGYYSNYLTPNITKDNNTVSYNGKRFLKELQYNLNELPGVITGELGEAKFQDL